MFEIKEYNSCNHSKFLLMYHIVFVIKYRQKLMWAFEDDIKDIFYEISKKYNFEILEMETDKDHIHILISSKPTVSVTQIVRVLKQISTFRIYKLYGVRTMRRYFYHENTFWSDGYFCCSIGNASKSTIENYIRNQG